jgi:hypothetical protein
MHLLYLLLYITIGPLIAAESPSFVVQGEFPNYAQNIQGSNNFSLQGDTTWYMQPAVSPSFAINAVNTSAASVASSSAISVVSTTTVTGNGLRDESLQNRQSPQGEADDVPNTTNNDNQASSEALRPAANSSASSDELEFNPITNPDTTVRLVTGEGSSETVTSESTGINQSSARTITSSNTDGQSTTDQAGSVGVDPNVDVNSQTSSASSAMIDGSSSTDTYENGHTHEHNNKTLCMLEYHQSADEVLYPHAHSGFHWYHWIVDVTLLIAIVMLIIAVYILQRKVTALQQPKKTTAKRKRAAKNSSIRTLI